LLRIVFAIVFFRSKLFNSVGSLRFAFKPFVLSTTPDFRCPRLPPATAPFHALQKPAGVNPAGFLSLCAQAIFQSLRPDFASFYDRLISFDIVRHRSISLGIVQSRWAAFDGFFRCT
jgi:hypothetical protein